ncbi:hypothetical protein IN07_11445 [Modestobacter caceresii]|uniref:Uncharacterized protein n=2 Tax=Modestobacter caceresii TaxID=1522368 RepID=A0A098Y7Z5_9ACTN|nr:hypothetical protein IN07_11445 [Modestobacter caceresii]
MAAALNLHARGRSIPDVAADLGTTPDRAVKLLGEGIAGMPAQQLDERRATSELRLNQVARLYGDLLDDADPRVTAQAANGLLTVERDRARLLGTWQKPPREDD